MLIYNKIKKELTDRNINLKDFFGKRVGLSEGGFHQAVRNNSLKVRDLEEISKVLGLSMTHWFEDDVSDLTLEEERTWNEFKESHERRLLKEQMQEIMRDEIIIKNQTKKIREIEEELNKCRQELMNERKRTA
jgi:hypothetical protein